jgi:hypothetical protein
VVPSGGFHTDSEHTMHSSLQTPNDTLQFQNSVSFNDTFAMLLQTTSARILHPHTCFSEPCTLSRIVVPLKGGMDGVGVSSIFGMQAVVKVSLPARKQHAWEYHSLHKHA